MKSKEKFCPLPPTLANIVGSVLSYPLNMGACRKTPLKTALLSKKLIFQILSNLWPLHLQLIVINITVNGINSIFNSSFCFNSSISIC